TARTWSGLNMPEHAIDDFACKAMRAQTEPFFPAQLAVLFTKANLLLSTGLVTQDAYDGCVGKMQIQGPGEGVFVYERIGGISDESAFAVYAQGLDGIEEGQASMLRRSSRRRVRNAGSPRPSRRRGRGQAPRIGGRGSARNRQGGFAPASGTRA
ncbi:MAG TPA: hypothetical protein VMN76_00900, partial [Acidobacteriota bacterium]|nr:hypothetical protein [Acidobacteriota bacterium]